MNLTRTKRLFHSIVPNLVVLMGILLFVVSLTPYLRDEAWYFIKRLKGQQFVVNGQGQRDSVFARYLSLKTISVVPVNDDFSIVIEKIGVNAPIIKDVSVWDALVYNEALKSGVAHAASSQYPSSEPGNVYMFAHSSLNFWDLGKYAQVFNLLRKLDTGDVIHVFYEQKDFKYVVVGKEIHKGFNTYPLDRVVLQPVLTLQTCDPPGTTLNRLTITAKLVSFTELTD